MHQHKIKAIHGNRAHNQVLLQCVAQIFGNYLQNVQRVHRDAVAHNRMGLNQLLMEY